jgi:diguanylate cyclase (GGDEF)-like protein
MLSRVGRLLDSCLPSDLKYVADRSALHRGRALAAILLITLVNATLGLAMVIVLTLVEGGGWSTPLLIALGMQSLFTLALWLLKRFAAIRVAALLCAAVVTVTLAWLIASTGGFPGSPLSLFLLVQPFVVFVVLGRREALVLLGGVIAIAAYLSDAQSIDSQLLPPEILPAIRAAWPGAITAIFACFWYLDYVNRRLTAVIARERDLAQFAAGHDALTGLLNRLAFEQRLEAAIDRADIQRAPLTLLLVDLDGFKAINDSHGHQAGDHLLRTLAGRIRDAVRQNDSVARLGGDEFALLLEGDVPLTTLDRIVGEVLQRLAEPVEYDGQALRVSGSIGVAACPLDARDAYGLLRCADVALYRAKDRGKNAAVWFDGLHDH